MLNSQLVPQKGEDSKRFWCFFHSTRTFIGDLREHPCFSHQTLQGEWEYSSWGSPAVRHTLILSLKVVWVPTAASVAEQAAPAQLLVEVESGNVSRTDSGVLLLRANVQLRRGSKLFRKERHCGLIPTLMHTLVLRQEVVGVALATPVYEQLAPSLFGRGNTNSDLIFLRCVCTFWFLSILTIFSYFRHLIVGAKVAYNQDLGLTSCIPYQK